MSKTRFEEEFPDYQIIPSKASRWTWPLTWATFAILLVGAPGLMFYKLGLLQIPSPNEAGMNQFSLPTLGHLAERQSQTGNHSDAVKNFSKYFELGGKDADLMAEYAYSLSELGEKAEALKWSREAVRTAPNSKVAHLVNDALEKR